MCEYQRGTFECTGHGYIWDADYDGYDPDDHSWPCPNCNTLEYLESAKEEAESTSWFSGMWGSGCGVDIWKGAVANANHWNPDECAKALVEIGKVVALKEDWDDDNESVETFIYVEAKTQTNAQNSAREINQ